MAARRKPSRPSAKSRALFPAARILLAVVALSLAVLAAQRGHKASLYFSPPAALLVTVASAELTDYAPMANSGPRSGTVRPPIPTRLTLSVKEHEGVRFEVALRSDPERMPPPPPPGQQVTITLPEKWRQLVTGGRVLAFGVSQGGASIVDPAAYPYTAEYRTLFLAVVAGAGALVAALGAWRLGGG